MNLPTMQERNDRYVRRVFAVCGGNVDRTAAALGIGRATTYRWLKRLGVNFEQRMVENAARQRKPVRAPLEAIS